MTHRLVHPGDWMGRVVTGIVNNGAFQVKR